MRSHFTATLCLFVHLTIAVVTIITDLPCHHYLLYRQYHPSPPPVPPNAPAPTAVPVAVKSSPPSDPLPPLRKRHRRPLRYRRRSRPKYTLHSTTAKLWWRW